MSTRASTEAFEAEGADAWFTSPPARFLGNDRNPDDYEQVTDILDVWFDSGSTHVFTVENPIDPEWPQRRSAPISISKAPTSIAAGSSPRCWKAAARAAARPTTACSPTASCSTSRATRCRSRWATRSRRRSIAEKNGADILRLWAASSDFTEDLRIGQDIIKANVDAYRRLRNTIRFMLANLAGFDEKERIAHDEMPELERYMLAQAGRARRAWCARAMREFDFNRVYTTLFNFCTNELSAFYFDIRKDALYCDAADSAAPPRRAHGDRRDLPPRRHLARAHPLLHHGRSLAAALPGDEESVHLQTFSASAARTGRDDGADREMEAHPRASPRRHRRAGNRARATRTSAPAWKRARCSIVTDATDAALFDGLDLGEIAITSHARRVDARSARRCVPPAGCRGRGGRLPSRRGRQMRALLDDPAGSGQQSDASRSLQPLRRRGATQVPA